MFQNYFKIAFRNILKHKFYSALNISGLALGLASCFLIGLYVLDELTYDEFHKDYENIYSVALHGRIGGQELHTGSSSPPLSQAMVQGIPGVEEATRIRQYGNVVMKFDDKAFTETEAYFADSNFFEFFSFRLLEGDLKQVLKEPNTLVMTTKAAKRYFGTDQAVGKIVTVGNDNKAYKVTGISEEAPGNSSIKYDVLFSGVSDENMKGQTWTNNGLYTYNP
ncbi:MAG: ABC transporter permease [Bacteroidota bacterium]